MKKRAGGLVYSTDKGRACARCGWPVADCHCATEKEPVRGDGIVRVGRETKHRRGKGVTIVTGVPLAAAELRDLAKQLKKKCGSGGTVRDGVIEIQGDHRDLLVRELEALGWTVKRAGG